MKKLILLITVSLLVVTGCVVTQTPPHPPLPKITLKKPITQSPKAASAEPLAHKPRLLGAGVPPTTVPTWTFKTNGNFQIDASTNLTSWWQVAVVYNVTNITITSATTTKRPMLFYRLTKI